MIINVNTPHSEKKEGNRKIIENCIFDIILELGIPLNLKGFSYLCDAIRITYYEPMEGARIVDKLYKSVAEENETTVQCVEHAIRTALKRVEGLRVKSELKKYFGTEECPPPKRFINTLADWVRRNADENANRTDL